MSKIKSGYITGTNEQLQAIRPYLVEEGFVDDKEWNDTIVYSIEDAMEFTENIQGETVFTIFPEWICNTSLGYSLSPDEDLKEAAKIIKQKFYGH